MRHSSVRVFSNTKAGLQGLGLIAVASICGSCQKFPANSFANYTAITVTFRVNGVINPNYIYDVAFEPFGTTFATPGTTPPLLVLNSSSPNGRMSGSPCEFVEFPSAAGVNSAFPFTLNQFALSTPSTNSNDPGNPINLGVFMPSTLGQITNFSTPWTGGDPSTLTFTIYTNELTSATGVTGQKLLMMQLNILTMTRVANLGSGARVIDALGPTNTPAGLTDYLQLNLLSTLPTTNAGGFEPPNDTLGGYDPDVDIIDYTITISTPQS